jgi:3,4-dihydroxy 2-butanone 4-phosphate synthase/GTP cyclohydrolase II
MPFSSIEAAIEDFRAGRMVVIVDDEDRENEGDLAIAADAVTPESITFMATHGRGLICLALDPSICDRLDLPLMSKVNTSNFGTAFTESIDAKEGTTTGISSSDRARTIQVAIDPQSKPEDLARPGHVFPLRAQQGGVLVRAGQTEAGVDLARLAGRRPGAVICEIVNPDGTMARLPQLIEYCKEHRLSLISVADLIRYRLQNESYVRVRSEGKLDTRFGPFKLQIFENILNGELHAALVLGELDAAQPTLVRMHSHCIFGDIFHSAQCDCRRLLDGSMEKIAAQGSGVVVYLHLSSTDRYQPEGHSVTELIPHLRMNPRAEGDRKMQHQVGIGAQILRHLNCRKIQLLTNSTVRAVGLEGFGIEIVGQIPVPLE